MRDHVLTRRALLGMLGGACLAFGSGSARGQEDREALPPLLLHDFEGTPLGGLPHRWRFRPPAEIRAVAGVERAPLRGASGNSGLKLEYTFGEAAGAGAAVDVSAGGMLLPAGFRRLATDVFGDGAGNDLVFELRDGAGAPVEARRRVDWHGWERLELDFRDDDRRLPEPVTLERIRLLRRADGELRGALILDNVVAESEFRAVLPRYDSASSPAASWRALGEGDATASTRATSALEYLTTIPVVGLQFELGRDGRAEFRSEFPAGEAPGVFVARVYGDASQNLLKLRFLDAADRGWEAAWPGEVIDWSGWRTIYVNTSALRGPDAGAPGPRFPLRFRSLVVEDGSRLPRRPGRVPERRGELFVGRFWYCLAP